jgi:hypothetical protein
VTCIGDPADMPLRDRIEVAHSRVVLERTPRRNCDAAARHEYATHFANRRGLIRHELETLMASQHREMLVGGYWKGNSIPLAPVNRRIDGACHGEHRGCNINADDARLGAQPLARNTRDNPGATGDIDKHVSACRRDPRHQLLCERPEQRSDQNTLVDFGERRRHE